MGIRERVRELLYIKETPHLIASSFALGAWIGFSAFLGFHTLIGLAVCVLYKRINRFALFAGMFITNPWTIIPAYTFSLWLGATIVGVDLSTVEIDWSSVKFSTILEDFSPVLIPYAVGTTVVSTLVGFVSYFAVKSAVIKAQEPDEDEPEEPSSPALEAAAETDDE